MLESEADSCRAWTPSLYLVKKLAALKRGYDLSDVGRRYSNKVTIRGCLSKLKVLISCLAYPSNIFDGYVILLLQK